MRELHASLAALPSLAPGDETNDLFARLVALAVAGAPAGACAQVLADPGVVRLLPHLRRLCSDGEFQLERAWARRIVDADDPRAELAGFPYLQNYRDLTRLEYQAVAVQSSRPLRRVLFVGSGPLPLSSLMLTEQFGLEVDNLDVDPEAIALGRGLAAALDVPGLRFIRGDVLEHDALGGYDLVCLAALVGMDRGAKTRLLAHLRTRLDPGGLLLARSAHSLRSLLYPVLDMDDLTDLAGLEPLSVVHPYTEVVNSVVIARTPL